MSKKLLIILGIVTALFGCVQTDEKQKIQKVAMLTEGPIEGQDWEEKGYKGLLRIKDKFDVDLVVEENIHTEEQIIETVDELAEQGVNLIFGHGSIYGKTFTDISSTYADIQFVYFNGGYYADNVTSLTFNSHAMGFFGGMVASQMTETNEVGIIAAYEWQPEIEGFFEGAKYQDSKTHVQVKYINNWDDQEVVFNLYETMKDGGVDIFYPAGDSFSRSIIERAHEDQLSVIGYVADQSNISPETVLTSTVQNVEKLYEVIATKYNDDELPGRVLSFDFEDDLIYLGTFSPDVPEDFQELLQQEVEQYKETGLLPNQR